MGAIANCFRSGKGVLRSSHPQVSFAAKGPNAEVLLLDHSLANGLGEQSPLGRLYELGGWVLLLGVGHDNNTSLHLAEYRANYPKKRVIERGAPIMTESGRQWVRFSDIEYDTDDFAAIGEAFRQEQGLVLEGKVGAATALLMPQRELVDFAAAWMGRWR